MPEQVIPTIKDQWKQNIQQELGFWRHWLQTAGLKWPHEYNARRDPQRPLQATLTEHFHAPPGSTVRILDVGAGPLTALGKLWPGRTVKITATDALADAYDELLEEMGVDPLARTIRCDAEHLVEQFGENRFDIAHAMNSLDHAYDPVKGIGEMVHCVRVGGLVYLRHAHNEGERQKYHGLHQWNFCEENNRFIVWRGDSRVDVLEALGMDVQCEIQRDKDLWIQVWLTRRA